MEVLDTTLREGEQCCGVFFPAEVKVRLARLLDEAGVDFIEVGHPAAAPSIREAARAIGRLDLRTRRIAHARLVRDEILLVRELGLAWVGLFSGINGRSLRRYGLSRQAAMERITGSVRQAQDLGLSVRFTCEDASRTGASELLDLYGRLRELGVDRMSYADTVGTDTPERLEQLSQRFGTHLPFSLLHFHFHDDRGRALQNAVRAAALGARCIDGSVLGIGERAGIVPLEYLLALRAGRDAPGEAGPSSSGEAIRSARAVVASSIDRGRFSIRRFAHKSGIHIHGVCSDPRQYEHALPGAAGGKRLIVLSKLIGRTGLRLLLARHGLTMGEEAIDRLCRTVKSDELLELAEPREIVSYLERSGAVPVAPASLPEAGSAGLAPRRRAAHAVP